VTQASLIGIMKGPPPTRTVAGTRCLVAGLCLVLMPYILLACFAWPSADDLTYALDTRRDGYWVAYRDQLRLWNGRYASNLFELGGPMVWRSIWMYRAVAVAMILATAAVAYAAVRTVTANVATRSEAAAMALCVTLLFLAGAPSLGESIYWYTGSVTYQLSAVLAVLQVVVTMRALGGPSPAVGMIVAAAMLLVVAAGMNEVALLLVATFYAASALVATIELRRRDLRMAMLMLAISVVAGMAVSLAPGNAVRSAFFPARHQGLRSLVLTALQTLRFAAEWTTSGALLLGSLLFLPIAEKLSRVEPWRSIGRPAAAALAAGTIAVIPVSVFPAYWATGMLGQHRTVSVAYFVFLLLWFSALTALVAVGWAPGSNGWLRDRRVRGPAFALLAASLAITHNGYGVAADLARGRARLFARAMAARFAALDRCAETPAARCGLEPIAVIPESFYAVDISSDPNDWVNAGYAAYFGLGQVVPRSE
jgi:hypothetical protein